MPAAVRRGLGQWIINLVHNLGKLFGSGHGGRILATREMRRPMTAAVMAA